MKPAGIRLAGLVCHVLVTTLLPAPKAPAQTTTNYLQVQCPGDIVVSSCTNVPEFYAPTVTDTACLGWTVVCTPPSGSFFAPNTTNLVMCSVVDYCGVSNYCSFTVIVLPGANCPTNPCCGPGLGLQSIQWLQLPTNTTRLLPNPLGANTTGTWIITNLPGYGDVLVTQAAPTNVIALCTNSDFGRVHTGSSFDDVPSSSGSFRYMDSGYGPYAWGVLPGSVELAYVFPYGTGGGDLPSYTVTFYFLDGQPNPCSLVLATIGLARYTTNTISQPVTFRSEYDLFYDPVNYPLGPSADTVLDGVYGPPMIGGVNGTVISSGFDFTGGDDFNTGYAIFQPTNALLTAVLPSGSGHDINFNPYPAAGTYPYLTITVNHELHDVFSVTVGYLCCTNCPTNCLQVVGSTNKTVQCGTDWTFDPPAATSCCTNEFVTGPATETNVLITVINTVTNGACPDPMEITRTWSIIDGCGDTNTWSQTVTVLGCCPSSCINLTCPADIVVATCSNCVPVFYAATGTNTCCFSNVVLNYNPPSGTCFPLGTSTVQVTGYDPDCASTPPAICSFTVTVVQGTNCCTNQCCGPGLGPQTIQWLQFPTNGMALSEPSGTNPVGSWIVTNLPCYGRVLVTQNFPDLVYWFLNPYTVGAPNGYGTFNFPQGGYGPYGWGIGSWLDLYASGNDSYTVNFYFLDGPPSYCSLVLGIDGLAQSTVATVSQSVTFRAEYDLNSPLSDGTASAYTTLNGIYGPAIAGATGTNVGSAYALNGFGDDRNTGWAILQPTGNLPTTNLAAGSVQGYAGPLANLPYLSLHVTQQPGDGIGFTVGYICCPCSKPCLQVQCPADKTIPCGTTNWSFDTPTATSCCTNEYDSSPGNPATNVLITSTGIVTNGVCPLITITESWLITDLCGDSTNCSQTVTVECCPPPSCIDLACPGDMVVTTCSNCAPVFYSATGTNLCCTNVLTLVYNPPPGSCFPLGTNTVQVSAYACGFITNCEFTVTVNACTNCFQVQCPSATTVPCGSAWTFDSPTATTCCSNNVSGTKSTVLITPTGTVTNGVCPQVITRTWLITDGCGDTETCTQTVTVVDTTPPMIHCPTNVVIVALNSNCLLVIPHISVIASDNCTPLCSLVYTQSPPPGTILAGPNATVTVTVTDVCGNSNSCVARVEGEDKAGPVVTCPGSMVATNCTVPCVPVTATDNCCPPSSLTFTQSPPCGALLGPGVNSVTVTVTDCHGYSTTKIIHLVVGGPESFLSSLTNTGVGPGGILLVDGTVDPYYSLPPAAVPAGMPADYFGNAVAVSDTCHATGNSACAYQLGSCYYWTPWSLPPDPAHTSAASKWIAPNYTNNGCCPSGGYSYALTFSLPGSFNPATATISGRWAADNEAFMYLNSHPVPVSDGGATINGNLGFAQWTYFTIPASSGFVTGPNTLTLVVSNTDNDSWTALRVEFTNAYANCLTCAPPVIHLITPAQSLQAGSTATFNVVAGGTAPLSYQWSHNNVGLAGATNSTLQLHPITYADAGLYSVLIANPCGVAIGYVRLNVTPPWWWQWGWWQVPALTNPLMATVGPALNLVGAGSGTNFAIAAGTTEDFGLAGPGGQIVNVMDINPQAGASIQVPMITAPGTGSDPSYTLIMDLYEPRTSLGTPSTLFQSIDCCVSNLTSGGQDGLALTLDTSNNLHIAGSASGVPFDSVSSAPLPVDAWNRVALVVDNPQDGGSVTLSAFINGQDVIVINPCTCCILPFTAPTVNWAVSSPTVLSTPANAAAPNGEFYVAGIQFHDIALSPDAIAGIGAPDSGPAPGNETSAGAPPVLSATLSGGEVNLTWSGSLYALQETSDLASGLWRNSALPFTEGTDTGGNVTTAATAKPNPNAPMKFYRLVFRP